MGAARRVRAIAAYRAFAGIGIWIAPRLTGRLFGFESQPVQRYVGRLAGSREAAFALGPLISSGRARRDWLRLSLACDVLDTVAAVAARRSGYFTGRQAALTVAATGFSALLTASAAGVHEEAG